MTGKSPWQDLQFRGRLSGLMKILFFFLTLKSDRMQMQSSGINPTRCRADFVECTPQFDRFSFRTRTVRKIAGKRRMQTRAIRRYADVTSDINALNREAGFLRASTRFRKLCFRIEIKRMQSLASNRKRFIAPFRPIQKGPPAGENKEISPDGNAHDEAVTINK